MALILLFGGASIWLFALVTFVATVGFVSPEQRTPPQLLAKDVWGLAAERLNGRLVVTTSATAPRHLSATVNGIRLTIAVKRRAESWFTTIVARVPALPNLAQTLRFGRLTAAQRRQLSGFELAYKAGRLSAEAKTANISLTRLLAVTRLFALIARRAQDHPWVKLADQLNAELLTTTDEARVLQLPQAKSTITLGAIKRGDVWHTVMCGPRTGARRGESLTGRRSNTMSLMKSNVGISNASAAKLESAPSREILSAQQLARFGAATSEVNAREIRVIWSRLVTDAAPLNAAANHMALIVATPRGSPYR